MRSGDLHIDFRSAEVADTVSRPLRIILITIAHSINSRRCVGFMLESISAVLAVYRCLGSPVEDPEPLSCTLDVMLFHNSTVPCLIFTL